MNNEDFHKKRLRNKGALIGAGIGAIAGGAGNYFRKDKDKRSAKDALIGAAGGAGVGGLAGGAGGHMKAMDDKLNMDEWSAKKDLHSMGLGDNPKESRSVKSVIKSNNLFFRQQSKAKK